MIKTAENFQISALLTSTKYIGGSRLSQYGASILIFKKNQFYIILCSM